ncbi:MAG: DUF2207 domain-containing protein [Maricaulaceae bacterium]
MKIVKFFICLFIGVLSLTSFAAAEEAILSYDVTIDVQKNADIIVTERIAVLSQGNKIRRGIFRDLPRLKIDEGQTIPYQYKILSVTRNGKKEPFSRENKRNAKQIRIGDADTYLSYGEHVYEITYRVKNEIRFEDDYDELYWNVTGNYWAFPIRKASAKVILPEGTDAIKTIEAFTGGLGQTGDDYKTFLEPSLAYFQTLRPLSPHEGLTVSVMLDKGVIDPLTAGEERLIFWFKNGALLILSFSLLGILIYYVMSWRAVGRDPDKLPVFARYGPPEGYSPAAAHYIYHRGLRGDKALIATLIGLGIKNRVNLDVSKKRTNMSKISASQWAGNILEDEDFLFSALFSGHTEKVELDGDYNPSFTAAYKSLKTHLIDEYASPYYKWNGLRTILGVAASVAAIIFAISNVYGSTSFNFLILLLALFVLNIVFIFLMPAPTKKGQKIRSEIAGFRLYLKTAEAGRLNAVEVGSSVPPPMTKDRYEAFLPYAVALGVEKPWSKHFENVLPREAENYNPHWGSLSSGHYRGASDFSSALTSSLNSGVASAMPQSSSSSGGGGFSGGGGGGGGGGGW